MVTPRADTGRQISTVQDFPLGSDDCSSSAHAHQDSEISILTGFSIIGLCCLGDIIVMCSLGTSDLQTENDPGNRTCGLCSEDFLVNLDLKRQEVTLGIHQWPYAMRLMGMCMEFSFGDGHRLVSGLGDLTNLTTVQA